MDKEATRSDISRRQLIKRGAVVGGAALWVPPVVQSLRVPAFAQVGSPPPVTCIVDGFMTGGGAVKSVDLDYELHTLNCPPQGSNVAPHLTATWAGNTFVATSYTNVVCSDDPNVANGANADFDTISGSAVGTLNGTPGATAQFQFVDGGEGAPPNGDRVTLIISDENNVVVFSVVDAASEKKNQTAHLGVEAEGRACT